MKSFGVPAAVFLNLGFRAQGSYSVLEQDLEFRFLFGYEALSRVF